MTEPVKPIGKKTQSASAAPKKEEPKKVKIGGIEFRKDEIDKTSSYVKDGKKINSVFLKNGVQIDYPNQTDSNKNPHVESRGDGGFWGNDLPGTSAYDVDNAVIYGNKNKTDFISLSGKSSSNEVIVNQEESWYVNGNMQHDYVDLGPNTENNTVHMDKKDRTHIFYNQTGIEINGEELQSTLGVLKVEGEGVSSQEEQLKDALPENVTISTRELDEIIYKIRGGLKNSIPPPPL